MNASPRAVGHAPSIGGAGAPSGPLATLGFVPAQQPAFRAFAGSIPPRFVNEVELECAKMLDYYGVPWEYEPTTFVLERDGRARHEGVHARLLPPEQDLYVEVTVMRQSLVTRKNRKLKS